MAVEFIPEGEEDDDYELGDDLDLPDGNLWVPQIAEFMKRYGAEAVSTIGGSPVAYIPGKGAVSFHDLLKTYKSKSAAKIAAIKGGKQEKGNGDQPDV